MLGTHVWKQGLFLFIISIILVSISTPMVFAEERSSVKSEVSSIDSLKDALISDTSVWSDAIANDYLLNLILTEIVPDNGKYYDPLVEKVFWDIIVPNGVGGGEYAILLFEYLIPSNFSNGYYYTRFFKDIITSGYNAYRLGRDGEPFVGKDAFMFYYGLLFAYLVPRNFSDGYYFNQVFYVLYKENKWGFGEVLAWIAYRKEFGTYYATMLTKIDLEEYFKNFTADWEVGGGEGLNETINPGTLYLRLYGPTGPLKNVYVTLYDETLCSIGYCYSEEIVSYDVTNESGVAVFKLPPGTYKARLYGIAYGEIHGIVIESNKTTNITKLLGKVTIVFKDAAGNNISGLSFTLYNQIYSSWNITEKGLPIASISTGSNGSASFHIVEGRYMARPYLPGYNTYINDIVVKAGKEHTYVFNLDVKKVVIRAVTPVPTIPFYFTYRIRSADTGVEYTYRYYSNGQEAVIWLKPGNYVVDILEIEGDTISVPTSISRVFSVGYDNEPIVEIPLSVLVVDVPSLHPNATLPFEMWSSVSTSTLIKVKYLGSIGVRRGLAIPLPTGVYYFEAVAGYGSNYYNFTVDVSNLGSIYNVTLDMPLGYLNVTTISANSEYVIKFYSVYLQETIEGYTYPTQFVTYGATNSLIPLLPGNYTIFIDDIGAEEPLYNISIVKNSVTNITVWLGRIIVNTTSFNNTPTSIPILVFPYDNETGEPIWDFLVYSTYTDLDTGIAIIDLLPGTYAVAIPGKNVTYYWWTNIGYGTVVLNLTLETASVINVSFSLGRLAVNISAPFDYKTYPREDYYIYIMEQRVINGTPVYGDTISMEYLGAIPTIEFYDLTPGVYAVGIGTDDGVINDSIIYNVVITPNGFANISFSFGVIEIQVLLNNTTPIPGIDVELYTTDGRYIAYKETSNDGMVRFIAPPGGYIAYIYLPDGTLREVNVVAVEDKITYYNTSLPVGTLRVHVRGPDGNPVVNYRVLVYEANDYDYFNSYTDANGSCTFILPPGAYIVYPNYYSSDYEGLVVNVTQDSITDITLNLSLVLAYINTSFETQTWQYIYLVLSSGGRSRLVYVPLNEYSNEKPVPIYLTQGSYKLMIPGSNTSYRGRYGYGEEVAFTINESEVKELSFNLTALVVKLYTKTALDRYIYAILIEQINDETVTVYYSIGYEQNPLKTILVTPGTYTVALYGPPYSYEWSSWGVAGHSYTWYNVTATMDNVPILEYAMGLAIIKLNVSTSILKSLNTKATIYALYNGVKYRVAYKYFDDTGTTYLYLTEGTYLVTTDYGSAIFNVTRDNVTYVTINPSYIEVILRGPDGEPVTDAKVNLYTREMTYVTSAYTNKYGKAVFMVEPGNYTIVLNGLNYYYSQYNGLPHYNINFGYGLARNVTLFKTNISRVVINLSRIDVKVNSPLGNASGVLVILYDNISSTFIQSGITNNYGVVSLYVTNGSYRIALFGYNYGWEVSYLRIIYGYLSAGYGDLISTIHVNDTMEILFTYNISAVQANFRTLGGEPVTGQRLYVYAHDYTVITIKRTDENGTCISYLTQGSYYIEIPPYEIIDQINITTPTLYYYNKSFAKVSVNILAPSSNLPNNIVSYSIQVRFYEDYVNASIPGTYLFYEWVRVNSSLIVYIPANISVAAVIPGYRSLGYITSYGYGDARVFTTNKDNINITFKISRLVIRVLGPYGPLAGIPVKIAVTANLRNSVYISTDENGYVEFLVTNGSYCYWAHVIPYTVTGNNTVFVSEYSSVVRNISLGIIRVLNKHYPDDTSFLHVMILDKNRQYITTLSLYDEYLVPAYSGDYILETRTYNGWNVSKRIHVIELNVTTIVFTTGALNITVVNIDNNVINAYATAELLLTTGRHVRTIYIREGRAITGGLTPGNYTLLFPTSYYGGLGYTAEYNLTIHGESLTNYTIKLGRIQVNLVYNNGTPAEGFTVKVYVLSPSGSPDTEIASTRTDELGRAFFDLTPGVYALWIEGLGYVHSITVHRGMLTNLTYAVLPADLAVTNISWTPQTPGDGDIVLVTANITNRGLGHVLTDFNVRFYLNGTLVKTITVHGLLAGYYVLVTAPITVVGGIDEVRVVVDEEEKVYDSNRDDNSLVQYITVLKPDLLVLNASITGEFVDGGRVRVSFNITNLGPGTTHRTFYVKIYHGERLVGIRSISGLDVGEIVSLSANLIVVGGYNEIRIVVDPDNRIGEENETNNVYTLSFMVPSPDLAIISAILNATEYVDGGLAVLNITVSNIGEARTYRSFFVKLFIDGEYVSSTYYSDGIDVNESINIIFYMMLKGGIHNVTIIVDPDERIPDLNRSNNIYTFNYTIAAPDIAITSFLLEPSMASEGEEVTITFTIANIGDGETKTGFYVDLYINDVITSTIYIETPLAPGDNITKSFVVKLDAGNHTAKIIADPLEVLGDSNRSNNIVLFNIIVLNSDLELLYMRINASNGIHNGANALIEAVIRNNGPGNISKPFYISLFDNNKFVDQIKIDGVNAGENITVEIPVTLLSGNRTYKIIVDDHYCVCFAPGKCVYKHRQEISDPNRDNNIGELRLYVPGPDLVVTNISVDPSTPIAWGEFIVNITVKNIGDYLFNGTLQAIISIDNNNYFITIEAALAPGETTSLSTRVYRGVPPGKHIIKTLVDPLNLVTELNESNNVASTTVYIPLSDIEIVGVSINPSGVLNDLDVYNVTITIRNNGGAFDHYFYIGIKLAGANWYLKKIYIGEGMSSGETRNITVQLFARPPGLQQYIIVADCSSIIPELNETNNYASFNAPKVRSLDINSGTYVIVGNVSRGALLRIVNTGSVVLEITNIFFNTSLIELNFSEPFVLKPGEHKDFEIKSNATSMFKTIITIETNTSYKFVDTITIFIASPESVFSISAGKTVIETSLTGEAVIPVNIYSSLFPISRYRISFSGNGTLLLKDSKDYIVTITTAWVFAVNLYADPSRVSPGKYYLNITATNMYFNISKSILVEILVHKDPVIVYLVPKNNTYIASNTLVVTWRTNVPTNGTLFFREAGDKEFIAIPYEYGVEHRIQLGGLLVNHTYEFYIITSTIAGNTTTGIYRVTVRPSVSFRDNEITVKIKRDYMQVAKIPVVNNDMNFGHTIVAWIVNPYNDLVLNFVGKGSMDESLLIPPGSEKELTLVIHAADTVTTNYTVTAILLNLDNNASDTMIIHIIVEEPVFDVKVEYLGMDNYTLVQTYKIINNGDTITDLTVYLTGPASSFAYVFPSMNHVLLKKGQSMIFYVIPVLSQLPDDINLTRGTIVIETKDPRHIELHTDYFKPPKGFKVYRVIVKSMTVRAKASDWYCTNRPNVVTKLKVASDPPDLTGKAILYITFRPESHARPHNGQILVNGVPVYSWTNTIPTGIVEVEVPLTILNLNPSGGVSEVTIEINTQHMNEGHYIVATNFELLINIKGGVYYIAARSYEEAREKVYSIFKPNMVYIDPVDCETIEQPPAVVKAIVGTLKNGISLDIGKITGIPDILKDIIGTVVEADAKIKGEAAVTATTIDISISGSLHLEIASEVVDGSATGKLGWAIKNCEWRYMGGEVSFSLKYGKQLKVKLPKTWLAFINKHGIKLKAYVLFGLDNAVVKLDENLRYVIPTFMIGIEAFGVAELELSEDEKLSVTLKVFGTFGWENDNPTGKIGLMVSGDVSLGFGPWEYTYSGEWGIKFLVRKDIATGKIEWGLKPLSDPYTEVKQYAFYSDELGFPHILLADQYSSSSPSVSYIPKIGLVAVWIASNDNETKILYSIYNGSNWSIPQEVPAPAGPWYTSIETTVLHGKLIVLLTAIDPFDPINMTYEEVSARLNNKTLYYMVWDGNAWSPPDVIAHNVSGLVDVASSSSNVIAAWKTSLEGKDAIAFSIMANFSWSAPSVITSTKVDNETLYIRDIAVTYLNNTPMIIWTRDIYRNETGDTITLYTGMYYIVYQDSIWSTPKSINNASNPFTLDAVSDLMNTYVVWSGEGSDLYVIVYNGTAWSNSTLLGYGSLPVAVLHNDTITVLVRNFFNNTVYTDISMYIINTSDLSSTEIQYVTNDTLEDDSYDIGFYGDVPIPVWTRRPSNTSDLPEGYVYAYGLYYIKPVEVTITSYNIQTTTVEGNPVNVKLNITNSGEVNASLNVLAYLNDTLVYAKGLDVEAGETVTYSFSVTPLDEGKYVLRIVLSDITPPNILGEPEVSTIIESMRLLDVYSPVNNSFVENITEITGVVRGFVPANVTLYLVDDEEKPIAVLGWTVGAWEALFNTTMTRDGPVKILVKAYTSTGAEDSCTLLLLVDNTQPTLEVLTPSNNSFVARVIAVNVTAYDEYYELPRPPVYRVDNTSWTEMEYVGNNTYYVFLDTRNYTDGIPVIISINVTDASGKTVVKNIVVVPDNTPPVTIDNATTAWLNNNVTIVLNASDNISGVYMTFYRVDGGEWVNGTIVRIPAYSNHSNDGVHVIEYYSIDNIGNIEPVKTAYVYIDTCKPTVTVEGLYNNSYVRNIVTINGSVFDELSGVAYIAIFIDDTKQAVLEPVNNTWSYILNTTMYGDGVHVMTIMAMDNAGNNCTKQIEFTIDNTPPTAAFITPMPNSFVNNIVEVEFNYSDDNIDTVTLVINGTPVDVTGVNSYVLNTSMYHDGVLVLLLNVTDKAGNYYVANTTLVIDNTPPEAAITSPAPYTLVAGKTTITFTYNDTNLYKATLYINNIEYNVTGLNSYTIDTTQYPDGYMNITLVVHDLAGNFRKTTLVLMVDNTAPIVTILSPSNGTKVETGSLEIKWNVIEPNIDKIVLYIDNKAIEVTGVESYTLDIDSLTPGNHTITIYAVDKLGHESSTTITIMKTEAITTTATTTTTTSTTTTQGFPTETAIAITVMALLAVAIILFLRRNKIF